MNVLPKTRKARVRLLVLLAALLAVVTYFVAIPYAYYCGYEPREGDIIFQSLPRASELVVAIEGVTGSTFSHCGVVVRKGDAWFVTEALGAVHDTPLFGFVLRGRGRHFAVYRLTEEHREDARAFVKALKAYRGRPYDCRYRLDDEYIYSRISQISTCSWRAIL